jgi:hypothetical protein
MQNDVRIARWTQLSAISSSNNNTDFTASLLLALPLRLASRATFRDILSQVVEFTQCLTQKEVPRAADTQWLY